MRTRRGWWRPGGDTRDQKGVVRTRGYIRTGQRGPGEDGGDEERTRATRRRHEDLGEYKMALWDRRWLGRVNTAARR